jgi:GNAT superfamily N-acetyltransferase
MPKIRAWLERQQRDGVHGTFLCNWGATEQSHKEGKLLVYIDDSSDEPVGYQWGGLLTPGILEVRDDLRGRGIGKALVEQRLFEAAEADEDILHIQCKPSTSIRFWERMGFKLRPAAGENYALRYMPRTFVLPKEGVSAQVVIEWFSEARKWSPATPAVRSQCIAGALVDGGQVHLAERALCATNEVGGDLVLRVSVDDEEWYCDKAKYRVAEQLGVKHCQNGIFLDMLYRPDQSGGQPTFGSGPHGDRHVQVMRWL